MGKPGICPVFIDGSTVSIVEKAPIPFNPKNPNATTVQTAFRAIVAKRDAVEKVSPFPVSLDNGFKIVVDGTAHSDSTSSIVIPQRARVQIVVRKPVHEESTRGYYVPPSKPPSGKPNLREVTLKIWSYGGGTNHTMRRLKIQLPERTKAHALYTYIAKAKSDPTPFRVEVLSDNRKVAVKTSDDYSMNSDVLIRDTVKVINVFDMSGGSPTGAYYDPRKYQTKTADAMVYHAGFNTPQPAAWHAPTKTTRHGPGGMGGKQYRNEDQPTRHFTHERMGGKQVRKEGHLDTNTNATNTNATNTNATTTSNTMPSQRPHRPVPGGGKAMLARKRSPHGDLYSLQPVNAPPFVLNPIRWSNQEASLYYSTMPVRKGLRENKSEERYAEEASRAIAYDAWEEIMLSALRYRGGKGRDQPEYWARYFIHVLHQGTDAAVKRLLVPQWVVQTRNKYTAKEKKFKQEGLSVGAARTRAYEELIEDFESKRALMQMRFHSDAAKAVRENRWESEVLKAASPTPDIRATAPQWAEYYVKWIKRDRTHPSKIMIIPTPRWFKTKKYVDMWWKCKRDDLGVEESLTYVIQHFQRATLKKNLKKTNTKKKK